MNCIRIFLLIIFSAAITSSFAQVFETQEEAFSSASNTNKKILLIFSGSDWCAPCVQFDKTILSTNTFKDFATTNLIVLKADFPQRKKLSKETQAQNDALAERYNPSGQFPELVLLRSDKSVVTKLVYNNQSPDQFISEIAPYLSK
jgi:thioredoxin-related protein